MSVTIDGLPTLWDVISNYSLDAKKSLGQNFLTDLNLTQRIARDAGDLSQSTVIEIGPGPGSLTRAILMLGAKKLVSIERDERCLPALKDIAAHYPERFDIISGDALETDLRDIAGQDRIKIIANLPYNIGTQLLLNWLTQSAPELAALEFSDSDAIHAPFWQSMTLMFQKEVGQRIVAKPNSSHYGRLGVLCGWMTHASISFDVSREAFSPPPKVTSSIVHLEPNPSPIPCRLRDLEKVTQAAFGQRRKMLRQSLKPLGGEALLKSVDIDPTRRAETLEIEEFCRLANAL